MTERITDENGWVAIRHLRHVQKFVEVGNRAYVFVVRAGSISIAFVHPDDVDRVLAIKGGCCGRSDLTAFILADETHVRRWRNNGGR